MFKLYGECSAGISSDSDSIESEADVSNVLRVYAHEYMPSAILCHLQVYSLRHAHLLYGLLQRREACCDIREEELLLDYAHMK